MRYPTATAFRRALDERLNRRARTTGEATIAGAVAWWSLLSSREPRSPASSSAASAAKRRQGSG
jgi:hypothetical protein